MDLKINQNKSKYAQCNLCLSPNYVIDIKGEHLSFTISICEDCIKKINEFIFHQ
jgi:hypothetical protein